MSSLEDLALVFLGAYRQLELSIDPLALRFIVSIMSITLFAAISGSLYEVLSRREIFRFNLSKRIKDLLNLPQKTIDIIEAVFTYTILFPLITLIWTISIIIFLLALADYKVPSDALILALSIVASTRICAYFNEAIALDIAKLLPIGLLAVLIANPASLSYGDVFSRVDEIWRLAPQFSVLFIFLVIIEWVLRFVNEIKLYILQRLSQKKSSRFKTTIVNVKTKK